MNNKITSDFLMRLNMMLSSHRDFRANMTAAMRLIGHLSHHDRIHIIEIKRDMTPTVVHEWCEDKLSPFREEIKNYRLLYDPGLENQLCEQNYIKIDDTDEQVNEEIKKLFQHSSCHRGILFPLFESESRFSFIAFMQCGDTHNWSEEEIKTLTEFASIIAINLDRYLHIRRLLRHISQEQKKKENGDILKYQLRQIHAALLPDWEQLRNRAAHPNIREQLPEIEKLDQHIQRLDRMCRTIFVK